MISFMMLFGCQATELNYENPLDVPAGEVPAIVFEPSASQIPLLSSSLINIFAVEVKMLQGSERR